MKCCMATLATKSLLIVKLLPSIPEIVSQLLNVNIKESNDDNESECVAKLIMSTEELTAINVLRSFFLLSEAADEHLSTFIEMLEKVVLTITN